jgi:hypothetical protein
MLDIVFLQKRIDVLERALPLVLEEHQLKGLYLTHSKSREEINETFRRLEMRDRLISYFHQTQQDKKNK